MINGSSRTRSLTRSLLEIPLKPMHLLLELLVRALLLAAQLQCSATDSILFPEAFVEVVAEGESLVLAVCRVIGLAPSLETLDTALIRAPYQLKIESQLSLALPH